MEITYHGHSCFKLKGKNGSVVTDPYHEYIGFKLSKLSADIVTISHDHKDHNQVAEVAGTAKHSKPFTITAAGEYEVGGISIFGIPVWHDADGGTQRGRNLIFTIVVDDVRICHLGDLGHELTTEQISQIGAVDVVLCPVGGVYTIDAAIAAKVIHSLEPSIVIPMHYKTDQHDATVFGEMQSVVDFMKEYGAEAAPLAKLNVEKNRLPEETELVVLAQT